MQFALISNDAGLSLHFLQSGMVDGVVIRPVVLLLGELLDGIDRPERELLAPLLLGVVDPAAAIVLDARFRCFNPVVELLEDDRLVQPNMAR